jgi:ATP-dependent Lhr-like helicase
LALERLREVTGSDFQRIGLSATVGNPTAVAKFIAGTGKPIDVISATLAKDFLYHVESPTATEADYELAGKLETSPEAAARIRRLAELVDSHKSTIIFVNSRTIAEMLGHKFSQLSRTDVAVHHGSLSREERVKIEDEFKAGVLKAIICTSTLELGIDIGNVDLTVQYMSPRQVNTLIQRVGRSGHRLDMLSEGVIITVFSDDTLEAIASVKNARDSRIEPMLFHEKALDVLAHQIVGILMDREDATVTEVAAVVHRAYPYRKLGKSQLLDVIRFLDSLNQLRFYEEGKVLRRTRKSREYYYGNLSMIPDERRYPVINVLSDREIGTLGDEFMALDARVGLNFIMRGKVWRIIQIEEETGRVHVVPSEDPFAAVPGWDGEILPVPFDLAQHTGRTREKIGEMLKKTSDVEVVAKKLARKMATDKASILEAVKEIDDHLKEGGPLPTQNHILIEAFDKYIVIHACFGEIVNRTLGGVFDSILTEEEVISGWWTDGYRILVEAPRKLMPREVKKLPAKLFHLTDDVVDEAFKKYANAKFPFAARMKFVAERFGVLPRGKTMSYKRQSQLKAQLEGTPIYDETLREAMIERVDLKKVKHIMHAVQKGKIKVSAIHRSEKPTPIAYHILTRYADISELMAPERVLLSNIDKMKMAIEARIAMLLCMKCGEWTIQARIKNLPKEPECAKCGSRLLALLYRNQDVNHLKDVLRRRRERQELSEGELRELTQARRKADLVLSYGKNAIRALKIKGVGPETASRVLGKMHPNEDEFYLDLLKAKIQFLRTREYWNDK